MRDTNEFSFGVILIRKLLPDQNAAPNTVSHHGARPVLLQWRVSVRNAPFGFGKGRRDKTGQRSSCAVPAGFRVHRLTLSAKAVQQEAGLPRAFLVALLKDENIF